MFHAEARALALPILIEALKIVWSGMIPPSLYFATEAIPIDAMQPHDSQSGRPPNWQGVISVFKSADNVLVVSAKIQSLGECGGEENWRMSASDMSNFGYRFRSSNKSEMTCFLSSGVSISGN